ncbi:MAG TPA: tyrosine-type recombinase/integrase [Bacteroidia bacterium]|nr:tyrosine-type recombinase/integrase [Bacteroidia bacterium]
MASIKFIVRGSSETASIHIRFKEGRLIDLTAKTNFIIDSGDWSDAKGQPKTLKDEGLKSIHSKLTAFKSKLLKHYNETSNKLEINSQWLKDFINPPQRVTDIPDKLVYYFDYYTQYKKNEIGLSTVKKLTVVKNLVIRFQKETKTEYFVKDVDANFKLRFEDYCLKENYASNTIARTIKFIKTICYHARTNGIETNFQLDSITAKYIKVEKIYLAIDELKAIEKVKLDNDNLLNARDWLLISCETGQRVSDFLRFTKDLIRYENKKPLIEFTQVKTGKIMTVPLSKKVLSILKKRKGDFPKSMSDQKYNDYIKDVCREAGLTKKVKGSIIEVTDKKTKRKKSGVFEKWQLVSSHIGRRSFSTNNYGIIPTSLLIGVTGHSTEKMFLEYIGKSDTQKAMQLAEYF